MEPQEKAKELINQYEEFAGQSKECALICIEEIQAALHIWDIGYERNGYWDEVKKEIEKL